MDEFDDPEKQERIRTSAVSIVLLMTGLTLVLILMSPTPNSPGWTTLLAALAFGIGVVLAGWILNGTAKGERMVFAPTRLHLWLATVSSSFAMAGVAAYMFFMPERLYAVAYWPLITTMWAGVFFVPESVAKKRRH